MDSFRNFCAWVMVMIRLMLKFLNLFSCSLGYSDLLLDCDSFLWSFWILGASYLYTRPMQILGLLEFPIILHVLRLYLEWHSTSYSSHQRFLVLDRIPHCFCSVLVNLLLSIIWIRLVGKRLVVILIES